MSRLIDADAVLQELDDTVIYVYAAPFIKMSPTVYDVDKVVQQIHEYFMSIVDNWSGEALPWEILDYNKDICEIVRRGGVSE